MTRSKAEFSASREVGATKARSSEVLRTAVDLFVLAPAHERAEIRAFADLVAGLLPDAATADRAHVAGLLAHRADTPPTIARLLATDAIEVARDVVLRSPVLTSSDLVQIMRCGADHLAAVAERLDLSPDVVFDLGQGPDAAATSAPADAPSPSEVRAIVEVAMAAKPVADPEVDAEVALLRALDELAAELASEEAEREVEAAGAAAGPDATTAAPGEIDAFLRLDPAARWRVIQDHSSASTLAAGAPRRRRSGDPAATGARLFAALVAGDRVRLGDELATAADLDADVADRVLADPHGEPLAITLAALGIDERTATSILLLHGGAATTLAHMQDLSAMAGRIGWRTAEHIVATWRGDRAVRRGETLRVLEPAERRGSGRAESRGTETAGEETPRRRAGDV